MYLMSQGNAIYQTQNTEIAMNYLLGIQAFNLNYALEIDPNFLSEDAHEHDNSVYSVAFVESGQLDMEKVSNWISNLLRTQGQDIFRMKGILNIAGMNERLVLQGVHMLLNAKPDRLWKPEEIRRNELVFIGRNLDEMQLKEELKACLV
ncbi:hypothetical protein CY0110_10412 [Crocosphaera chwakensis CCY0110]|uniref:CobW C-terminal domain-containing protein n=1 Tax=Crocosphaera chwakensis CCY0110 TaxID=391612 RepID=A3IH39_9CHRO|nr:hypothetical protein CY0110_10412 [Crocosphaera chwakensis CCY0110]